MVVLAGLKGKWTAWGASLEEYYDAKPYQRVTIKLPGMRKTLSFKIGKDVALKCVWLFRGIADSIEKQHEVGTANIERHKARRQRNAETA